MNPWIVYSPGGTKEALKTVVGAGPAEGRRGDPKGQSKPVVFMIVKGGGGSTFKGVGKQTHPIPKGWAVTSLFKASRVSR